MADHWRAAAACRGKPPEIFYPSIDIDDENTELDQLEGTAVEELGLEAKRICAGCPVARPCLRFAVRVNDRWGVWSGLNDQRRQVLRRLWQDQDLAGYSAAVDEALAWVAAVAAGEELEVPDTPGRECGRCGSWIEPNQRVTDRNGPGATCGLPSTYNKGCRCRRCIDGKIAYRAASNGHRGKVSQPLDRPTRSIRMTETDTKTEAGDADVVPINGTAPAKKTAKKAAKKAAAKETRAVDEPTPLPELFADDGLDWSKVNADAMTFEEWNQLGDNVTRADTGGPWWVGDWWVFGEGRFTEEQMAQVIDPLRITPKTVANRAWLSRRIPREHRRPNTLEWSIHRSAAEVDDDDDFGKFDAILDKVETEGYTSRETTDLAKWVNAGNEIATFGLKPPPADDDGDDDGDDDDPTRCEGSLSIYAGAGYKDDMHALMRELEDIALAKLEERGIGGARVSHTVK